MDSILTSVKKMLGIDENYTAFDADIVMYINSAFVTLNQIGAGPAEGFFISDKETSWNEYSENMKVLNMVKPYVARKVRLAFDPPTSSTATDAIRQAIAEDEFRINLEIEGGVK